MLALSWLRLRGVEVGTGAAKKAIGLVCDRDFVRINPPDEDGFVTLRGTTQSGRFLQVHMPPEMGSEDVVEFEADFGDKGSVNFATDILLALAGGGAQEEFRAWCTQAFKGENLVVGWADPPVGYGYGDDVVLAILATEEAKYLES